MAPEDRETTKARENQLKLIYWFLAILGTLNVSCVGYIFAAHHTLDLRVTTIEASRFTAKDAAVLIDKIAQINERLTRIQTLMERDSGHD